MKHTINKWLSKLKGERAVKLNRLFHAVFYLDKQELRATEKICRDTRPYNYVALERY